MCIQNLVEVVVDLQSEPKLGTVSEEGRQPEGRIGTDAALSIHNFVDAARGYANLARQCI